MKLFRFCFFIIVTVVIHGLNVTKSGTNGGWKYGTTNITLYQQELVCETIVTETTRDGMAAV